MSAEVLYRARGVSGDWVVDVWESRGGEIPVLVDPTNNAAERSLRHAVIWCKLSFGNGSATIDRSHHVQ